MTISECPAIAVWPEVSYHFQSRLAASAASNGERRSPAHLGGVGVGVSYSDNMKIWFSYRPRLLIGGTRISEKIRAVVGFRHKAEVAFSGGMFGIGIFHQMMFGRPYGHAGHLVGISASLDLGAFGMLYLYG